MSRKVLLITYYWPPSGGSGVQRPLKFVKYLSQFGWEPIVYTVSNGEFPEYDVSLIADVPENLQIIKRPIFEPFALYKWFTGKKKDYKLVAGYPHQKKVGSLPERIALWLRSNLFIPDARMFWILPSIVYLKAYLKKHPVDAILTTGPPHSIMLIGLGLKRATGIPWLADFRDPWTQIDYWEDLNITACAKKIHKYLEKKVLHSADAVVCVGKTWGADLEKIANKTVHYIPNGFDEDDTHPEVQVPLDDLFTIVHIGMMGKSRNHEVFWEVIAQMIKENDLFRQKVRIKLYGKWDESVVTSIRRHALSNYTELNEYVPHNQIIKIQKSAQLLYLSVNDTANASGILTGKIYEYLASGRPIVCIGPPKGEAAQVIAASGAGRVSDFNDALGLRENIAYYFGAYLRNEPLQYRSALETYTRKYQTGQLASLLNTLVKT